jgi:hypothetical protein
MKHPEHGKFTSFGPYLKEIPPGRKSMGLTFNPIIRLIPPPISKTVREHYANWTKDGYSCEPGCGPILNVADFDLKGKWAQFIRV